MDDLLKLAIEAHGGLERWRQFNEVRANVSITGALWHLKGQPDVLINVQVVAQLHRQHLVTHLIGKDRRTIFTTGQISIESESGVVEETLCRSDYLVSRAAPRHPMGHAACSLLCELRTVELPHHSIPLHLSRICQRRDCTMGGNGEQWRSLKVTFPDSIAGHTRNQISYLGSDGLLRSTNIPLMFLAMLRDSTTPPITERRTDLWCHISADICLRQRKVAEPLLVAIDIHEIEFN
jgi:hypothetical protein